MNLSTNTRYALRLLFELRTPGPPVATALLAEQTGISLRTVEKVQAVLRQQGITDGAVGVKGGIFLRVPLTEISLGQVISWFDGGIQFAVCYGDKANECPNQASCLISSAWGKISTLVQQELGSISLWSILQEYPEDSCIFSRKALSKDRKTVK